MSIFVELHTGEFHTPVPLVENETQLTDLESHQLTRDRCLLKYLQSDLVVEKLQLQERDSN